MGPLPVEDAGDNTLADEDIRRVEVAVDESAFGIHFGKATGLSLPNDLDAGHDVRSKPRCTSGRSS